MLVWFIVPFYDFCSFSSVAVNNVYKLQFLKYIFAVLLPGYLVILYSECLWKWTQDIKCINQSKSATTGANFPKGMVKRVRLRQRAKFRGNRSNRRKIWRFFKMAAAAILDFWNLKFLMVRWLKSVELWQRAKFGRNRSNRGRDMAIFQFFNMAATARNF